ncbi:MAG: hypothetical protein H6Q60_1190 [Oscillospiraceae bacterium]|nr:hypothetical protein [Oscillospiraceae bacterium]
MRVQVLVENTSHCGGLGSEHGLSLYIETSRHKLLFDTGASGLFSENAEQMGVDLAQVDVSVLSHGHSDHGGGIETFLRLNDKAKLYLHERVFIPHYVNRPNGEKAYIGLNQDLLPNSRFVFTEDDCLIDQELELFSGVKGKKLLPSGNMDLFKKVCDTYQRDHFSHEQHLIVTQGVQTVLVSGCAHRGIVNILEYFKLKKGFYPDYVIGGLHLYNPSMKTSEKPSTVSKIADFLLSTKAKFYTGHCTGLEAYERLKKTMGDSIRYLSTGDTFEIEP